MTFYMDDYKEDALKISDEQVAADWRFGLLRATAKVVAGRAYPVAGIGPWDVTKPGSPRAHAQGNFTDSYCPLVEIYEVQEERGEQFIHDSFADDGGHSKDIMLLKAKATCKCGQLQKEPVSMEVSPGELIYMVTNAQ